VLLVRLISAPVRLEPRHRVDGTAGARRMSRTGRRRSTPRSESAGPRPATYYHAPLLIGWRSPAPVLAAIGHHEQMVMAPRTRLKAPSVARVDSPLSPAASTRPTLTRPIGSLIRRRKALSSSLCKSNQYSSLPGFGGPQENARGQRRQSRGRHYREPDLSQTLLVVEGESADKQAHGEIDTGQDRPTIQLDRGRSRR
jgi:hypothetical protein